MGVPTSTLGVGAGTRSTTAASRPIGESCTAGKCNGLACYSRLACCGPPHHSAACDANAVLISAKRRGGVEEYSRMFERRGSHWCSCDEGDGRDVTKERQ